MAYSRTARKHEWTDVLLEAVDLRRLKKGYTVCKQVGKVRMSIKSSVNSAVDRKIASLRKELHDLLATRVGAPRTVDVSPRKAPWTPERKAQLSASMKAAWARRRTEA